MEFPCSLMQVQRYAKHTISKVKSIFGEGLCPSTATCLLRLLDLATPLRISTKMSIFRSDRMHSSIRCAPIATEGVAWSVCMSVCWSRSWVLQKWLNRSRYRCSHGTTNHVLEEVNIGRIHSQPWGMTSRRCGHLPNYFGHVISVTVAFDSMIRCAMWLTQHDIFLYYR